MVDLKTTQIKESWDTSKTRNSFHGGASFAKKWHWVGKKSRNLGRGLSLSSLALPARNRSSTIRLLGNERFQQVPHPIDLLLHALDPHPRLLIQTS